MMAMLTCSARGTDTREMGLTHLHDTHVTNRQLIDEVDRAIVFNVGPKMEKERRMPEIEMMGRMIDASTCNVRCSTDTPFSQTNKCLQTAATRTENMPSPTASEKGSEKDGSSSEAVAPSTPLAQTTVEVKRQTSANRGNGSLRKFLETAVSLDALAEHDVTLLGKFLAKLDIYTETDLHVLSEAFWESIPVDAKPITVFKLWNVLQKSRLIDTDEDMVDGGIASYRNTLTRMGLLKSLSDGMTLKEALVEAQAPKPKGRPRVSMGGDTFHAAPSPAFSRSTRSTRSRRRSGIYSAVTLFGHDDADGGFSEDGGFVDGTRPPGRDGAADLFVALPPLSEEANFADSTNCTAEGKVHQAKLREKMTLAAMTSLALFSKKPEDWLEWRDAVIANFTAAGRVEVLRPDFLEWACAQGMSGVEIGECDNWARAILKSAIGGCEDAMDAFDQAPAGKGSEAFCYMRRHFEIQGSHVKEKLRLQIENFAPASGEDPVAMGRRLAKLYKRHSKTINPEAQSEESRIRRLLAGAFKFSALETKVRMMRGDMTAGRRLPKERTFKFLQEEINAEWTSFGAEETDVKIHAARVTKDEIDALRKENAEMRRDAKELRVLVATGSAGAHLGQGKGGALTGDREKSHHINHGLCLVVACNNDIVSPGRSKNTPTMCMACWTAFHEGGDASKKLKDGRTVTKTNNAQWPKSVTIAKMMMRFQCQEDEQGGHLED
jgi:hypothetical protein